MGHRKYNQRFNWTGYLALLLLVVGSVQIHAQDDETAANVLADEGSITQPSLAPDGPMIEFRPENDPNMIDSEGDGPDSNTAVPLPTNLQEILSVHQRVGRILEMNQVPIRLPSSEGAQ